MSAHPPSADTKALIAALRRIVGRRHVLVGQAETAPYRTGYRFGGGEAVAVVRPGSLVEQWNVLLACVAADVIVLMQAANTGLTGGSTPDGDGYDRQVVVINTMRLSGLHLIDEGRQVLCMSGTTLDALERALEPLGREPHSVIGSSCIGASVVGGVCNNSGGSLIQRGPAFTRLALFARVTAEGDVELVNHLGIRLGSAPEEILDRLERGNFGVADLEACAPGHASDAEYEVHVRDIQADTPARFNADPRRLFEASGSAGRIVLFAVRLDTFPQPGKAVVFYIGANDPEALSRLRRRMLSQGGGLPISAEYMHRDAFDVASVYGKDTFLAIRLLGTRRLPALARFKSLLDRVGRRIGFGATVSDRLLQALSGLLPPHLPRRMRQYRDLFEHHLMLKVSQVDAKDARTCLESEGIDHFECIPDEADRAFLHRFAVAGAAVRYRAVHRHQVEDIVALDIALPRNAIEWRETLAPDVQGTLIHSLYYGHFFCHVFHQDYIVARGCDVEAVEKRILHDLDLRGAEYPAEHNVGRLYRAKPELESFYRALDPRNQLNPGIGLTSSNRDWKNPA